ncbi:MAG: hypothetical protein F6K28_53115 [Microcoleus sp. SIO2G3]|nr:hypothetical protein [Microcoleus sp. SIO2G3]
MTYLQRLHPWCIIRPFPDMRTLIVGRFRRRVDAEGHLRILKQLMPTVPFEIVFDVMPDELETCEQKSPEGVRK